jgi:hypothetical protein
MATFIFTASRNPIMDSQEASIRVTDCVIVSMMLLWITDGSASGEIQEFRANCRKLGDTAEIVVIYKDIVVTEDSSRTVKSLKSLSGKTHDLHHHVYGLTHAEPVFNYKFRPKSYVGPGGQTCTLPHVTVEMGFSSLRIYLAKELQESCRKGVVRDHEMEHVSAWKSHFRAGAKLLEAPLRRAFSQPRHYPTKAHAEAGLKLWVEEEMKVFWKHLMDSVISAQRAIDSPISYNQVKNRLRNCPPDANGPL